MPIKPIDLQTNIGQLPEVSKVEHARQGIIAEQQHLLDKQAAEKSNLVNSKLEQAEKGEKTSIMDEEKKRSGGSAQQHGQGKEEKEPSPKERMKDDKIGKIIDVLK
jgi:sRNA-binding protein